MLNKLKFTYNVRKIQRGNAQQVGGPKQEKIGKYCMHETNISLLMVVLMAVAVMITAAGCRREDTEPKTGGDTIIIGGNALTNQGPLDAGYEGIG